MKKILSIVLLAALCLSLFAGCGEKTDMTGLEKAKTYLFNLYKDAGETTVSDYEVVGVVVIHDYGTYNVEWTADNSAITITPNEKMVTIGIPASPETEISYKLTAKVSDDKGNSLSVSFDRKVPAGGNLADGTYVILNGNLTMSSLTQDKSYGYPTANEVTVAEGKVSNHFKADVLTITKVGDSYTIQDAYGRYFYLKGSYNSFNVSETLPEEGHLFTIGRNGDGYMIVNNMMQKTLAYSISYTSWGCYSELSDDHQSVLTIIPATAPETDPETPETPDTPDTPSQPAGEIETPVAGTAYKLGLIHGGKGNVAMYFTGVSKPNYPWYMLSTQNVAEAIDVFVEEVDGGLRLYFTIDGTKTYLDMHKDGEHYSLRLTTEPTAVYTWNAEHKTFVTTVEDKECFIGTSGTYDTFSCNKMEYIATSYVAHLYGEGGVVTPDEPEAPAAGVVDAPVAGTAYKFGMVQANVDNKIFYLAGGMSSYYMATTEDAAAAIDVYLEATEGGYYLYTMVDGVKTYINMVVSGTHVNGKYDTTASTVYTYDSESKTVIAMVNDAPYWFGTRNDNTYTTVGPVKTEYNGFYCQFYAVSGDSTTEPEKPETNDPAADSTLTVEQAIALGASKEHDTYTEGKYYVTGVITEVYNTKYGNMRIKDEAGNILTIYGTYSADGATGYDALEVKPVVGDTVTIYGIIGQYNGTPQIKNGWITSHTPAAGDEKPVEPEKPAVTGTATLADKVAVGDKIILVNAAGDSAMGAQDDTKRVVTAITVADGTASLTADVVIITLEAGSQEGTFALKVDGGYLAYSGSGNSIATQETVDDAASWTITFTDGKVSIQNVKYPERYLQYNISAPRFVCYKGTQEAPVIYKVKE